MAEALLHDSTHAQVVGQLVRQVGSPCQSDLVLVSLRSRHVARHLDIRVFVKLPLVTHEESARGVVDLHGLDVAAAHGEHVHRQRALVKAHRIIEVFVRQRGHEVDARVHLAQGSAEAVYHEEYGEPAKRTVLAAFTRDVAADTTGAHSDMESFVIDIYSSCHGCRRRDHVVGGPHLFRLEEPTEAEVDDRTLAP